MTQIELELSKSVEENAGIYFEKSKKLKKKIEGAKEAISKHEVKLKKLKEKKDKEFEKFQDKPVELKKEWYEKFRWFFSSEGFLVIGGRDATTNEIIIKKHTDTNDIVFHTDLAGSPFIIIKCENKDGKKPTKQTLSEAADSTVTFSRIFKMGQGNSPVFWVKPEQVSKEAQTGEFLTKGAFMIRGKTNYVDNKINLGVGKIKASSKFVKGANDKLMAGPVEAVKKHCKEFIILEQGRGKTSEIAKKIKNKFGGNLDDIIRILPAGGIEIKK